MAKTISRLETSGIFQNIQSARKRLVGLVALLKEREGLEDVRQEVQDSLEELHAAEEGLRAQNENLDPARESLRVETYRRDRKRVQLLMGELTLSEERERRKMAVDLHGRVSQSLAHAGFEVGRMAETASSGEVSEGLERVSCIVEQALEEVRTLSYDLSPPVLYELDFACALDWLVRQFREKHDLRIEVETDGQDLPLAKDVRVMLFRCVRELLVNIDRHARAQNVSIGLAREAAWVRIRVEDDGIGFHASDFELSGGRKTGVGLFTIREWLNFLGGACRVESRFGGGARVVLVAPLTRSPGGKL